MKKIFQVGAGLVGKTMALDLSKNYELHLGDTNVDLLNEIKNEDQSIHIQKIDIQNKENFRAWIADADIVLLAVPGFLGFEALRSIIECGKNVVDISFSSENVLSLNDLAIENDVCAVVDAGVAPGIPNFLLGYWNEKIKVNSFDYMVGGLPKNPSPPFNYKAPFSPIDVIEEYTRPARMMINSKVEIKPALSDIEELKIDNVGILEAFNTYGLRSILTTMSHIPNMKEKTLRYPGHALLIQSMIDKNLFDKNNLTKLLKNYFLNGNLKTMNQNSQY
jgi:lysine 6-dehydrogenase